MDDTNSWTDILFHLYSSEDEEDVYLEIETFDRHSYKISLDEDEVKRLYQLLARHAKERNWKYYG